MWLVIYIQWTIIQPQKKGRKTLSYVTIWMNLEDIVISEIAFQVPLEVKHPPASVANARNMGSISGLGRFPGGEHGNPLQYSCLEKSMDRGVWWAIVHGATKNWTWLGTAQHISKWNKSLTKDKLHTSTYTRYQYCKMKKFRRSAIEWCIYIVSTTAVYI